MKFDLQSLFGLHVHSYNQATFPLPPPHWAYSIYEGAFGLINEGAIGQPR
jgi:hypothetical protein